MNKYVYVVSTYYDGRVSHIDKWQCHNTCDTCNRRFICWTSYCLSYQEWNFGKSFPSMIYEGTVKRIYGELAESGLMR